MAAFVPNQYNSVELKICLSHTNTMNTNNKQTTGGMGVSKSPQRRAMEVPLESLVESLEHSLRRLLADQSISEADVEYVSVLLMRMRSSNTYLWADVQDELIDKILISESELRVHIIAHLIHMGDTRFNHRLTATGVIGNATGVIGNYAKCEQVLAREEESMISNGKVQSLSQDWGSYTPTLVGDRWWRSYPE